MKREEILKILHKYNLGSNDMMHLIMPKDIELIADEILSLSPVDKGEAMTAEGILHKHINKEYLDELSGNIWSDMLEAMEEYAELKASQSQPTKIYSEQDIKDEFEQAMKRRGQGYAEGYIEGLQDGAKAHRDNLIKKG